MTSFSSTFSTDSVVKIFLFSFFLVLIACDSNNKDEKEFSGPDHPGWYQDYLLQKVEPGKSIPSDFALNMQLRYGLSNGINRSPNSNLEAIEEVGPTTVAGRIRGFIVDWSNTDRYLAAGISGGLWESLDKGENWSNLTPYAQHLNISSITQSPFDPNIIYFSTGEPAGNSAGIAGPGIFKSTDGGKNFEFLPSSGVSEFFQTWKILHSTIDSNTFFVASPTGLFVSRDGGEFFDNLKFSPFTDVEILPSGEMYASTDGLGVYYSADGTKNSFKFITQGLPASYGRSQLAISLNNPDYVAVSFEDESDGKLLDIYRSSDKGQSWTKLTNPKASNGLSSSFNWYCQTLYMHPSDPDFIIYGASDGAYSLNGGSSWVNIVNVHADIHSATPDPDNEDNVLMTSDGGIDRLKRLGQFLSPTSLNNGINITQFYAGAVFPNGDVIGGTQDNGTWFGSRFNNEFSKVFGGDGAYCAVNPLDSNEVYISYQNGNVFRLYPFYGSRDFEYIVDDIQYSDDDNYFINPFYLNPIKPNQIFLPTRNRLWYTDNSGAFWNDITNPLNDIFAVATITQNDSTRLFFGGANGLFYRINHVESQTRGQEINLHNSIPTEVSLGFIREITAHPNQQSLFVVFSSFSQEDRVWRVDEIYSDQPVWTSISGDLPLELPVNTIVVNQNNADILAIGTDYGMFTTINGGDSWILEREIPQSVIYQMVLDKSNTLYTFTHGRGIFKAKLDDFVGITPTDYKTLVLDIYPNPSSDYVNFTSNKNSKLRQLAIYDNSGRLIKSFKELKENRIEIGDFSSGVYTIVTDWSNGKRSSGQFIKK